MAGFACPSNLSDGNGTSSSAGHNIILVVVDRIDTAMKIYEDIRDFSGIGVGVVCCLVLIFMFL